MLAFVFPGQGSQAVGMGKALAAARPRARQLFERADQVLGYSLSHLCFEGPADELTLTANAQPAILTCSVAAWQVLEEETGLRPDLVAGHSLGEYSALCCAGALRFEDAVRLVHLRGKYMQEAVPPGEGAMAALMGASAAQVEALCAAVAEGEVLAPANFNGAGQIVIAGRAGAVQRAVDRAREFGARRAVLLQVSAPFHCALMKPAADRLAERLAEVIFADPRVPVVSNVEAQPNRDGSKARELLTRQVTAPVRWEESVQCMVRLGVRRVLEVGPGKVLAGLVRRIAGEIEVANVERAEDLATVAGLVEQGGSR